MSEDVHKYPSDDAERFQVRMPPGLRERIREAAAKNNRSMNAEIVASLEDKYPAVDPYEEITAILKSMSPEDRVRLIRNLRQKQVY
jgi:hypothetical protein